MTLPASAPPPTFRPWTAMTLLPGTRKDLMPPSFEVRQPLFPVVVCPRLLPFTKTFAESSALIRSGATVTWLGAATVKFLRRGGGPTALVVAPATFQIQFAIGAFGVAG